MDTIYGMFINGQPVNLVNHAFPIQRSGDWVDLETDSTHGNSMFRLYWGTETQEIDTPLTPEGVPILTEHSIQATNGFYLSDLAQEWWASRGVPEYHPAYRGVCYFVARAHMWYSQTTCPKIEFVLGRWPGGGTQVGPSDAPDANLADVVADCLTNTRYGLGLPSAAYNSDDFAAAKATLNSEGMGLSPFIDRAQAFDAFLLEMLGYFDAY